jgi:hypothetical protein
MKYPKYTIINIYFLLYYVLHVLLNVFKLKNTLILIQIQHYWKLFYVCYLFCMLHKLEGIKYIGRTFFMTLSR